MVVMQRLNRQVKVPESDVDYMKAKGYMVVPDENKVGTRDTTKKIQDSKSTAGKSLES